MLHSDEGCISSQLITNKVKNVTRANIGHHYAFALVYNRA
jgi:hypothetical protein